MGGQSFMGLKRVVHPKMFNVNIQMNIQLVQSFQKMLFLLRCMCGGVHHDAIWPVTHSLKK